MLHGPGESESNLNAILKSGSGKFAAPKECRDDKSFRNRKRSHDLFSQKRKTFQKWRAGDALEMRPLRPPQSEHISYKVSQLAL